MHGRESRSFSIDQGQLETIPLSCHLAPEVVHPRMAPERLPRLLQLLWQAHSCCGRLGVTASGAMSLLPLKRKVRALSWQLRQVRVIAKAMHSRYHPIVAHVIPVRRCNLACAYCNEYDKVSQPVPTEVMLRRIDRLHELGTTIITFSGGEPLLHPDLDDLIRRIRSHG